MKEIQKNLKFARLDKMKIGDKDAGDVNCQCRKKALDLLETTTHQTYFFYQTYLKNRLLTKKTPQQHNKYGL